MYCRYLAQFYKNGKGPKFCLIQHKSIAWSNPGIKSVDAGRRVSGKTSEHVLFPSLLPVKPDLKKQTSPKTKCSKQKPNV